MWRNIFSPEKKRRDADSPSQPPNPEKLPAAAPPPAKPAAAPPVSEPKPEPAKASPHQPRATSEAHAPAEHRAGHSDQVSEEYERRMKVLSVCLEEKAEENIELWKKLQAQQELVQKRDATIRELQASLEAANEQYRQQAEKIDSHIAQTKHQEALVSEFTRRTQVLSMCLDEMAQENIALTTKLASLQGLSREELERKLQHFSKPPEQHVDDRARPAERKNTDPTAAANPLSPEERLLQDYFDVISAVKEDRARELLQRFQRALALESDNHKKANAHLQQSEEELTQQKANVTALEKQVKQLTSKLLKEKDQKQSFQESCEKYEKKMRKLEIKSKENLQKEGKRRQEAEYVASKLKKKVSELTFLLKEKADSSSEEEDSDSTPAASSGSSEASVAVIRASFAQPTDTPRPGDAPAPAESASAQAPAAAAPRLPVALVAEEVEQVVSVSNVPSAANT